MRNKPRLNLSPKDFEAIFKDDNELLESRLPKIYDIPINLIDDFPAHPFKVTMDEDLEYLIESIKEQGLITPVILRPKEKGRYELVSGHRRKEACMHAGLDMIRAEVREMTQDEAIILMVDSNLQRTELLPSEKAFSYKMRLEAVKRQGKRTDLTSYPLGTKLWFRSNQEVSEQVGDSRTQIARYIRLTELIPEVLDLVDGRKMGLRPAVELSYLSKDEQAIVYDQIMYRECTPSHAQTIRMRRLSEHGLLTASAINTIMREEKPNQKEKIHIPTMKSGSIFQGVFLMKGLLTISKRHWNSINRIDLKAPKTNQPEPSALFFARLTGVIIFVTKGTFSTDNQQYIQHTRLQN